ncbi:MAG: LCP family protein [Candidatus Eremiobacteraeota bacterium]|nr:LCP family protein [Candidatus Eremiobacteraeota bacterium]MBC5809831.1 LCP family protein [Candidatus Eremiobacteraeota bacterium]
MSDEFEPRLRRVKKEPKRGAHYQRSYDLDDEEEKAPREPHAWRSVARYAGLVAVFFVTVFLGALMITSIVQRRSPTEIFAQMFIPSPQKVFGSDRLTLLLLGLDYNYDSHDQPYSKGSRTDTIMAVVLNFPVKGNERGSISLVSVPRDMAAVFPDGHEDKINSAYINGKTPLDGARRSERVVADFLGIRKFDRFITFRINAAKEIVNAIGGVDVVADSTMDYEDHWGHLSIHFIGGRKYHMDGEQAVSYSRFRHDACGDPCRIKRQQQVMRIVLNKLSNDKLNDILHIKQLIGVLRRNVETDVTDGEALAMANGLRNVDVKKVKTLQVPFTGDKDLRCCGNVLIADELGKADLVRKTFIEPAVPPPPPDRAVLAAIAPSSIHIDVRNGSGAPGVAASMAALLRSKGFIVDNVGDASKRGYVATEVHAHSTTAYAGDRVRNALPLKRAVLVAEPPGNSPRTDTDVTIIVGSDWSGPAREASAVK